MSPTINQKSNFVILIAQWLSFRFPKLHKCYNFTIVKWNCIIMFRKSWCILWVGSLPTMLYFVHNYFPVLQRFQKQICFMISFVISAIFLVFWMKKKGLHERSRGIEMKLYRTASPAGPIAKIWDQIHKREGWMT